jgi:hypothetical protein
MIMVIGLFPTTRVRVILGTVKAGGAFNSLLVHTICIHALLLVYPVCILFLERKQANGKIANLTYHLFLENEKHFLESKGLAKAGNRQVSVETLPTALEDYMQNTRGRGKRANAGNA